jgi:hypothetical protein
MSCSRAISTHSLVAHLLDLRQVAGPCAEDDIVEYPSLVETRFAAWMSARGRARRPTRVQASGRAGATHRQQNTHKSTAVTRLTPALERKNLAIPVTGRDGQTLENCLCLRHHDRPARHSSERALVKHCGEVRAGLAKNVPLPFDSGLDELLMIPVRPVRVHSPGDYLGVPFRLE